ncbi:hypothetical protein [Marinomonas shanghaiensis]
MKNSTESSSTPKNYAKATPPQQACQDDLIKSQRQGPSVTLDALIN